MLDATRFRQTDVVFSVAGALPCLSYGGSSMFAAWLALGLVDNVHVASRRRSSTARR